uniref:Uncharacterized protein n=1 Tax=Anguilla anguilla TaxID=7936 RepID=A0A0E9QN15_ANGAN
MKVMCYLVHSLLLYLQNDKLSLQRWPAPLVELVSVLNLYLLFHSWNA